MARNARLVILCNEEDDDMVDMVKSKPHYHLIKVGVVGVHVGGWGWGGRERC